MRDGEALSRQDRGPVLGWLDRFGIALLIAIMVGLCLLRSRGRLMWSDETYSFTLLRDGRLSYALRGWWAGVDGGGLWYYVLGTGWMRVFGATVLSMRMFSMAALAAGSAVLWRAGRRFYTMPVMLISLAAVIFLPVVMSWQLWNGRFYGLFFFSAAWAATVCLRAMSEDGEGAAACGAMALSQMILAGSHVLGILYSGAMVAGVVVHDRMAGRRPRWKLYGSGLLSVLVVLVSFPAIRATTGIAKGVFWTKTPRLTDLLRGFFLYDRDLFFSAGGLLALVLGFWLLRRRGRDRGAAEGMHLAVWILIASFAAAEICLFVVSQRGVSLFSDRYLLPMAVADVFLLAELMTRVLEDFRGEDLRRTDRPKLAAALAIVVMAVCALQAAREKHWAALYPRPGLPEQIATMLPPGEPVAVTMVPVFTTNRLLDPAHRYVFLTDWAYDQDPAHRRADLSMQRLMENWSKGGITDNVMDLPAMEAQYAQFALIAETDRSRWVKERFGLDGRYELTRLGTLPEWYPMELWQVRRR